MKDIKLRIGNFELRFSQDYYEVVKWQPNPHYGKQDEYNISISENHLFPGKYYYKEDDHCCVHEDCFKYPETCYVILYFKKDREGGYYISTVGDRPFHLEEQGKEFIKFLTIANSLLNPPQIYVEN